MDPTKVKLTAYEQEIEDHFGETPPIPKDDPIYEQLRQTAIAYRKDKSINLRVNHDTLTTIKSKARKAGLPYQTLINTLLHQYATGQIHINL
jgi:predicted DNA binding CopG/RHH family protein